MKKIKLAKKFVLDCSMAMSWCFSDESNDRTNLILEHLQSAHAKVPSIWPIEVANVLLIAERKKRITKIEAMNFKNALSTLPITIDSYTHERALDTIYELAWETKLTAHDAAYLELALREGLPLYTLNKALVVAAKNTKIVTI